MELWVREIYVVYFINCQTIVQITVVALGILHGGCEIRMKVDDNLSKIILNMFDRFYFCT